MKNIFVLVMWSLCLSAQTKAPRIWDDKALDGWATPVATLNLRPGHFSAAEYYAAGVESLKTYPVYHPDREPPGYWDWLQKQKPEPIITSNARTKAEWVRAGETVFLTMDDPVFRTADQVKIRAARDRESWKGIHTMPDGSLFMMRWVVTSRGPQLSLTACAACHGRVRSDGTVLWGVAQGRPPNGARAYNPVVLLRSDSAFSEFRGDPRPVEIWRRFTVPWATDDRVERLRTLPDLEAREAIRPGRPDVFPRIHGSPFFMTKIPDLNGLRYSRYMDATGTHRLRGPEDVGRYAALVAGSDPMEFGPHRILTVEQRRVSFRFSDDALYALGVFLLSLEPPKNSDAAPAALIARGRQVFKRETCVNCHVPPNYTSGKLTLARGYTPPSNHPNKPDIMNVSVGTDPGLAMRTRKGTGFYKIPSLRGVWYRPLFLHDGSVASLEEMFDPARFKPEHVPGGWKGPGVTKRAIHGHPFGLNLNPEDKAALLAFLRSL